MDSARWERVQALFHSVADLGEEEARGELARASGEDAEMVEEVMRMVAEDRGSRALLDRKVEEVAGAALEPASFQTIGAYKIERVLGEGGMGTVFLGVRDDLASMTAIKVLRDAWISPERRRRFAIEQKTLAQLNHPNIARLLDADSMADGTPYFVMEYADGAPIDEHCEREGYTIAGKLRLFRQTCEAVQFAHRHAVIHRDLKPSNILVDSEGGVKLLDFGIAKHLDNLEADMTRTGLRLMTPVYASPEQIRGEGAGIQTDVYSLGVVLYQMLSGRPPFDVSKRSPAEALAVLSESEPVRPSMVAKRVRAEAMGEASWEDLDVLVLTAMHKDTAKRYGSVEALIRDIDHYLKGEPLEARPDAWWYRMRKFVVRRRGAVAASAAVAVAVGAMIAFFLVRLREERNAALAESARVHRMQKFMVNLFQGGDREAGPSNDLRVSTLIDRGVQEARVLDQDPAAQAEMYQTLGDLYQKLGNLEKSDGLLHASLEKRRALPREKRVGLGDNMVALGLLRVDQAKLDDAERLVREGLKANRESLPDGHPSIAAALDALGRVLEEKGKYDDAVPVLEEAVRLRSAAGGPRADLAGSLYELSNVHFYAGRYQESKALNERVLPMYAEAYGDEHPSVADVLINLGAIQQELGDYPEAEKYHRRALSIKRAFFGEDHYETASSMTMLARVLVLEKRLDEAEQLLRGSLAIQERVFGKVHPRVASALNELGTSALVRNKNEEAKACFRRMADIYAEVHKGNHYLIGIAISNLGSAYMAEKQNAEAERLFREALAMYGKTLPPDHLYAAVARIKLGRTLVRQKRYREGEKESLAGYEVLKKGASPAVSWLQSARMDLAESYAALGDAEKARGFRAEYESVKGSP